MRGRPAYKPDEASRKLIENLASLNVTEQEIIACLPQRIDAKTLRKHYGPELERGQARGMVRVKKKLHELIDAGNPAAVFFFLKCRAGWSEVQRIEASGPGGQPLPPAAQVVILPSKDLPPEQQEPPHQLSASPRRIEHAEPVPAVEPQQPEPQRPQAEVLDWRQQIAEATRSRRPEDGMREPRAVGAIEPGGNMYPSIADPRRTRR